MGRYWSVQTPLETLANLLPLAIFLKCVWSWPNIFLPEEEAEVKVEKTKPVEEPKIEDTAKSADEEEIKSPDDIAHDLELQKAQLVLFFLFFEKYLLINYEYDDFEYFRNESEELKKKLENLEKKILVGGENLLEKIETQEQLLEQAAKELEERKTREEHLTNQIKQKEVRRVRNFSWKTQIILNFDPDGGSNFWAIFRNEITAILALSTWRGIEWRDTFMVPAGAPNNEFYGSWKKSPDGITGTG